MYGQYTNSRYSGKRWKLGEGLPDGASQIKREGHNRQSYTMPDGTRRFRLHATDVVVLSADGLTVTLDDGGYATMTTRRAMSEGVEALTGIAVAVWGTGNRNAVHALNGPGRACAFNCPHSIPVASLRGS